VYKINLSRTELLIINKRRKKEKNKLIFKRLQCIYLAHKGTDGKEIAKVLAVNKNTVTKWIKTYEESGLNELCRPIDYDRRSSKIDDYLEKIKQDIKDNALTTLAELHDWLKNKYSLEMEISWLFRCCKKNSICLARKSV